MVIASIKPGMASWSNVTSPLAASVEITLPRSLNTLYAGLADGCVPACEPERQPASAIKTSNKDARIRRITCPVYSQRTDQGRMKARLAIYLWNEVLFI